MHLYVMPYVSVPIAPVPPSLFKKSFERFSLLVELSVHSVHSGSGPSSPSRWRIVAAAAAAALRRSRPSSSAAARQPR